MWQADGCGGLVWAVRTHPWLVGLVMVDVKTQRELGYHLVESPLTGNGFPERNATKSIGSRRGDI